MARRKIKRSISGKQKLLLEVAVGVFAIILVLGVLNSVTHVSKIPLVTTEDLLNNTHIRLEWRNSTDISDGKFVSYQLSDVATYYDGYLYISLTPPAPDYTILRGFSIYYINCTVSDLIDKGFNYAEIEIWPVNTSPLVFGGFQAGPLTLRAERSNSYYIWSPDDIELVRFTDTSTTDKYNTSFGSFNKSVEIGGVLIVATANGVLNNKVGIIHYLGDVQNLDGIKLKLNLYATSEKPVLKAFTEPVWGVLAGVWSTLLAVVNRVRQYIASFFGGFSVTALFTGLIGDPIIAAVIAAAAIAIFYFALARPAPRR